MTTDRHAHWRANLAGQHPKIYEDQPQDGWYMRKLKAKGPFVAAAIYLHPETGEQVCRVGNQMRSVKTEWLWLSKNPCTEESATYFFTHGTWPDGTERPSQPTKVDGIGPEPVTAVQDAATTPARDAKPGDNIGSTDPFETMCREATASLDNARDWAKRVGNKVENEDAAKAATDHVNEIAKSVSAWDDWKERVVTPLYRAYKAEQKKHADAIEPLQTAIAHLKKLVGAWQMAERDRLQKLEEERQREAERIEAENLAKLKEVEEAPLIAPPIELETVPEKIDTRATVKGFGGGRAVRLVTYTEYAIDNFAVALKTVKDEPEIREAMLAVAKRLHKTGNLPKGFKIEQKERAA